MINRFIISIFSFFIFSASVLNASLIPEQIHVENLTAKDKDWFLEEFTRSFMNVYNNKTFFIGGVQNPQLLTFRNLKEKFDWLDETAKEEFQDYVLRPQEGQKALLISAFNRPVGMLMYRLLKEEKVLYLAHLFVVPEMEKKGIGLHLLTNILPALHPQYRRHEVLTRHQNDAALMLYHKAGFKIADIATVQKYGYDPLRYISFYRSL